MALILAIPCLPASALAAAKPRRPCDLSYPSDSTVTWECRRIRGGESLERLFGERWQDVARFNRIDRRHAVAGVRIKVPMQLALIDCFTPLPERYAPADSEAKLILVDLSEQFLGAYERGHLVFSAPISSGMIANQTPRGDFRVDAYDRNHRSSLYFIEDTRVPYPMTYGLRFLTTRAGVNYWIHGRDLPGYPASHGCVGIYDEAMQKRCYGNPGEPVLDDAQALYLWAIGDAPDDGKMHDLRDGPRVRVIGETPRPGPR